MVRSHFLEVTSGEAAQIHVKSFTPESPKACVFLLHGAIEDGRIFYSRSGKGFAPFLARSGYAVYVIDLRGRGQSTPSINKHSTHGQRESILEDIPAAVDLMQQQHPGTPMFWGAHSWGGVLIMCTLARYQRYLKGLHGLLFFGSKRRVQAPTWQKRVHIDLFWNRISFLYTQLFGYLPAARLKLGSDSETRLSHRESVRWVKSQAWKDDDGFDYRAKLQALNLPPQLHLAGPRDFALGHPVDVRRFQAELGGGPKSRYQLLSRQHGFKHNYGHIDMLTHPDGPSDHFPMIRDWLAAQI